MTINWETLADNKRQSILDAIPSKWRIEYLVPPAEELRDVTGSYIQQFLTPREIMITETDAWQKLFVIELRLLTSLYVTMPTFIASSTIINQTIEHKEPIGPLHGLPVSLKDQFHVKGVETTMGGGSSGGEGALIALKGSPGGFGTDIGGSVRIPAAFNGLFGIRPSSGRIPYEGAANSMDGQNSILSVIGPLATTARSLTLLFKAVLSEQPWYHDPLVLELPWRTDVEQETRTLIEQSSKGYPSLAFAVMHHDGIVKPHPPIARALEIVEQTLKQLGHKVIEWKHPAHQIAADIGGRIYDMDGGADIEYQLALSGETKASQVIVGGGLPQKSALEIAALNVEKRQYQKLYMDYWNSTADITGTGRPVDGVICPCAPFAAVIPQKYGYIGYTPFVNVLDYTSVVFPVTHADKTIDVPRPRTEFLSEVDKVIHEQYDSEAYDGAPAGLQLVGRRLQEEKMLTLAEYIGQEVRLRVP
ncbi:Acetamidase [Aspergillus hancockii]|nr:Acetamidase [Aspergillus hancockii]